MVRKGKRKLDSAEDKCIHPPSGKKLKALKPDELPQALMPTPEQNAESIPVQQPVDPKTLQIPERSVYTCNECKQHVENRYHCTVCEDYDLCSNCYQKISHNHKMEKLDLEPDVDSDSNSDAPRNPQEARRLSIQRCIQSLVHACQCRDANCQLPSCQKMKQVVQHTKVCKRKTNGECPICKQLIALCCYHAKHCQEQICLVPFCLNIKHKLRQRQLQHRLQQAQHRLQQAQLLRQCMEHAGA